MRKKHENAVYFFALLAVVIVALVVFSPNFPKGAEVSEEEGYIEVDVQTSLEEAENLVGDAFGNRITCKDSDGGKKYRVLAYYSDYNLRGSEVIVTGNGLLDITVSYP